MRKSTGWVRVVVAFVCVGVGAFALHGGEPTSPKKPPSDDAWLPKSPSGSGKDEPKLIDEPPSAFPELVLPPYDYDAPREEAAKKANEAFEKLCPRFAGKTVVAIKQNDDTLHKLFKARLHLGLLESHERLQVRGLICFPDRAYDLQRLRECLTDMQDVATELWSGQPKELAPWLEELLVVSKMLERRSRVDVKVGSISLEDYYSVTRHRLKVETALWKAKNAK